MGCARFDGKDNNYFSATLQFKNYPKIAGTPPKSAVRPFENFDIATERISPHFKKSAVDLRSVVGREPTERSRRAISDQQAPAHAAVGRGSRNCLPAYLHDLL